MTHAFFQSRGTRRLAPAAGQRGVSLIIAMVMLVVIGFVSVAIMRRATSSDQVALNNRLQTQANQYAQAALQFCENQIVTSGSPITIQAQNASGNWTVKAKWLTTTAPGGSAYQLTATDLPSANTPAHYPQCIVEHSSLDTSNAHLFIVTARGFSDDYTFDSTSGATKSGSVVWLQSQVLI
jgi:Tfp pilus assembly protein PilX